MIILDKHGKLKFNSIQTIKINNDYGYINLGAKYITKEMIAIAKEYDPYASWVQDDWKESRISSEKSIDTITSLKAKGVLVLEFVQIPCSAYLDGYINDLINSKIKPFNSGKASKVKGGINGKIKSF